MAGVHASPTYDDTFGLHYPGWFIGWCVDAMRAWYIPPPVWLNVPIVFIQDIIRYINQSDAVDDLKEQGFHFFEPVTGEEEMAFADTEITRSTF